MLVKLILCPCYSGGLQLAIHARALRENVYSVPPEFNRCPPSRALPRLTEPRRMPAGQPVARHREFAQIEPAVGLDIAKSPMVSLVGGEAD